MESNNIFVGKGGQKEVFEFNEKFVLKKYKDSSKIPYISLKNSNCASFLHILSFFLPHFVPFGCVPKTAPWLDASGSWLEEDLRCISSLTVEIKAKSPLPFESFKPPWKDRFSLSKERKGQFLGDFKKFCFLRFLSTGATKENIKQELQKTEYLLNNKYFKCWLARKKNCSVEQASNVICSQGDLTTRNGIADTLIKYRCFVCFLNLLASFCEGQQNIAFELAKKLHLSESDFLSSTVAKTIQLKLRTQKSDVLWENVILMQRNHKMEGLELLELKLKNKAEIDLCKNWLRRFLAGRTACDCSLFITPATHELKITDFEIKSFRKIVQWNKDYNEISCFLRNREKDRN
eukprot:GHVP01021457.1.p1 GENE.GHVP01021457.1~~GHVP01021457.1.p1  ORF type:complete len:348 (+),score=67.03 GHVP01021457.1:64-1107(+)